jgi:hypothetical protein
VVPNSAATAQDGESVSVAVGHRLAAGPVYEFSDLAVAAPKAQGIVEYLARIPRK